MADQTYAASLTVYYCPPEQVKGVLEVREYHLGKNEWGDHVDRPDTLELGGQWGSHYPSVGVSDDIHGELLVRAPGAAWVVSEDPYGEWLGSMSAHTPGLGSFTAMADADGNPVFDAAKVREIARIEDQDEREKAIGDPWLTGMSEFLPPAAFRELPALPECDRHGGDWGDDMTCAKCVEILDERQAKERVILGNLPDSDLVYVAAQPSALVFECGTCADASTLSERHEVKVVGWNWPSESETHKAHKGFGIGAGSHTRLDMRIKEVVR